jgi:hypothetical protein
VVRVVDFGWFVPRKREVPPAEGPGQAAAVGDGGVIVAVGDALVVGPAVSHFPAHRWTSSCTTTIQSPPYA